MSRREIVLQNPTAAPEVASPDLAAWLERLVGALVPRAQSFTARCTSDREIRRLNRVYRGRDVPTDVLSFPGEEAPDGYHLGDVVISLPTARRQAAEAGHSTDRELRELLLHGLLHCLGYDHGTDDGTMDRLEALLREQWVGPDDDGEGSDGRS